MTRRASVLVVGGGPAGLTAAAAIAPQVAGEVVVIEREAETGGIPRHSDHLGYGIRDLQRFISGPAYARRLTESAVVAGATLETSAMVTGWAGERTMDVTSPSGRYAVDADVIVLATGARERPRPARRIPGDRPAGIYTTGQLQNLVHLHHFDVGERAVVVGAELVSWSAVMTLREAGCRTVAMTTHYDKSESYVAFRVPGQLALRVPVVAHTRLVRINGRRRVESVEVEDLRTGHRRIIECDTVVMTGDWIPDHELVRSGGLDLDAGTLGPLVDTTLTTSRRGVFAIGNLLHPVDTADVAALDGRHVAAHVVAALRAGEQPTTRGVGLATEAPLRWVAPQIWRPGGPDPARGRLLLWTDEFRRFPTIVACQNGREIGSARLPWPAAPGRVFRVPFNVVTDALVDDGPVRLSLR